MYIYVRTGVAHAWGSLKVDILWVGQRVGLLCILTVYLLGEILSAASIKVASCYTRKASNPLSGHHYQNSDRPFRADVMVRQCSVDEAACSELCSVQRSR